MALGKLDVWMKLNARGMRMRCRAICGERIEHELASDCVVVAMVTPVKQLSSS